MSREVSLIIFFTAAWTITIGNSALLLFRENTVFQFTIGISVPVAMAKTGTVSFNAGYQFNFVLPWNLTQLNPAVIPARGTGDFNLQNVYDTFEDLINKHGSQRNGECLLRTICEFAEIPFNRLEATGDNKRDILEDIIHLLLTPSEDLPEAVNSSHRSVNKLYQEAERLGRSGGDCSLTYPNCIESPLESFTEIVFP